MRQFKNTPTKKHFGQHWLIDKNILEKIVAAANLEPTDTVLEIGSGTGFLTQALAQRVGKVVAYDVDSQVQQVARENLSAFSNVEWILRDVLKESRSLAEITGVARSKIVANIPYNITSPLLDWMIARQPELSLVVLMIQKEMGDRLIAKAGDEAYSAFTICAQYHFETSRVWKVPPSCFKPPPRVDSLIVKLIPRHEPPVKVLDESLFFELVHASFTCRRKTLLNGLKNSPRFGPLGNEALERALTTAGIPLKERGENLDLATFAALGNCLI